MTIDKEERISIRMDKDVKEIIQFAADILKMNMQDFVIHWATINATRVIYERQFMEQTIRDIKSLKEKQKENE